MMKKLGTYLIKIVNNMNMTFMAITVLLSVIGLFADYFSKTTQNALPCSTLLWTLLFSFLLAVTFLISTLLRKTRLNVIIIEIIQFVLAYVAFALVYITGGGATAYLSGVNATQNKVFSIILMTFFFVGVYVVAVLVKICANSVIKKYQDKNKDYKPVYESLPEETGTSEE